MAGDNAKPCFAWMREYSPQLIRNVSNYQPPASNDIVE